VLFPEGAPGGVVARVQDGSVGKDQAQLLQGLVAVLGHAAAHAAGVVGQDAADLAGVDGGRVGADLLAEGGQGTVGVGADDARLEVDAAGVVVDAAAQPPFAQAQQDRIRDRLAREAGAGRAEGHVDAVLVGQSQDAGHFVFGLHVDDDLGDEPIEARVRAVGQQTQRVGDDTPGRNESGHGVPEFPVLGIEHGTSVL